MSTLASAIRAAVGGRGKKSRLEDERPEDLDEDEKPEDLEDEDESDSASEDEDREPDANEEDPDIEDDEEKEGEYARGRKAERKRMAAILGSRNADANPSLAAHLAFGTGMTAGQAIATLKAAGAAPAQGGRLADRMAGRVPALGNGSARSTPRSADEKLIAHAQGRSRKRENKR